MSNSATFPKVGNDFYKSNGADTVYNTTGPSLTRQEFMEECDINTLMSKYEGHVIGGPGGLSAQEPIYADFTQVPDTLLGYMNFMDEAQRHFMSLPALVRREFDNNAHEFVAFASDPGNLDQLRAWGLAPPKPAEPAAAQPAPAPGAADSAAPGAPRGPS